MNTELLYIIGFILLIIALILCARTSALSRKITVQSSSLVYGIKLNTLRIEYNLIKKNVQNYKLINEAICKVISLEKDSYVDIERLKMKRYHIWDIESLTKSIKVCIEVMKCTDERVINLFNETLEVNKKIAKIRFPIKCKINEMCGKIQLCLVLLLIKIFKKYKGFSKRDIDDYEKGHGQDYIAGPMLSL